MFSKLDELLVQRKHSGTLLWKCRKIINVRVSRCDFGFLKISSLRNYFLFLIDDVDFGFYSIRNVWRLKLKIRLYKDNGAGHHYTIM